MSEYNIADVFFTEDGSLVFNKSSIVSPETEQLTTKYYDEKMQSYLPITGGRIFGDLEFTESATIVLGGSVQSQAFDDTRVQTLEQAQNDTSQIFYDASLNRTRILGNLAIMDTITMPTAAISISNVASLQTNLDTLGSDINTVSDSVSLNTLAISGLQSDLSTTDSNVASNLALIQGLRTDVSGNIVSLQEHALDIQDLQTESQLHATHLGEIDGDISTINSTLATKVDDSDFTAYQSEINLKITEMSYDPSSNTTSFSNTFLVDDFEANTGTFNGNVSCLAQFSISNNDYEITTQQFGYLKDIDENVKTKLDALSSDILTNTNNISTHGTAISSHSSSITALQTASASLATRMDAAESDISNLETATSVLSSYGSRLDGIDVSLASIQSDLAGKQSTITSSSRLSASLIGDGTVSNLELATLNGIDDSQTIQHQIDTIKSSIQSLTNLENIDISDIDALQSDVSSLQSFATNQASTNSSVSSSISSLQSGKQNTITSGSKLSSELVSYGMTNVNSQLDNILTNVGSLQSFQTSAQSSLASDFSSIQTLNTFKTNQESYNSTNDSTIAGIQSQLTNLGVTYDASNNLSSDFVNVSYQGSAYEELIGDSSVTDQFVEIRDAIALSHSQLITAIETKNNLIGSENLLSASFVKGDYKTHIDAQLNNIIGYIDSDISGKQPILSGSNKLTSDYVDYNGTVLSDKLFSIDTSLNTLSDFKTSQESYNTSNDTAISNINTSLSGKQSTISTESRLASTLVSTTVNSTNGILSNVLQSITDINTSQSSSIASHTDDITSLNNQVISVGNSISTINTNITNLQSQDVTHSNAITEINTELDLKQDIISNTNKISGSHVTTSIGGVTSDLNTVLNEIDSDLTAIDTALSGKQSTLNSTSNKLPISYVDLSGSPLYYIDISSNLSTQLTNIKNDILTLNGLQAGDVTSFQNINSELALINQDLSDLDTAIQTKQPIIDASARLNANLIGTGEVTNTKFNFLKNVTSDIQTQINSLSGGGGGGGSSIPSITFDASNNLTEIADTTQVSTLKFSGDSSQQTTAFTSSLKTDLENNKTKLTDISYTTNKTTVANELACNNITGTTITNINNTISAKQDILDASANTLNPSFITGGSSLTSQKITWLSSIAQDLQTKLDALQSSIDALSSADSAQTTTNTNLTNSINTLTTDKQDLLSGTNKLNAAYINAGTGTMSNLKMQYLSSIGGDISDALASKWNVPINESALGYVDIGTSLNGLLSQKQSTITNGSLAISHTNGLQTALDNKQATITDGSLTIARTSGLQSALDSKQSVNSTYGVLVKAVTKGTLGANTYITNSDLGGICYYLMSANGNNVILPAPGGLPDGAWVLLSGRSTSSSVSYTYSVYHTNTTSTNLLFSNGSVPAQTQTTSYGKAYYMIVVGGVWLLGN